MDASKDFDNMDFKQSLFASYANIAIMELKLFNNSPEHLRPTHKEILYLYSIWSKPGCTATDLVDLFDSSKALVSQTIIAMEKKGYIIREKDPEDNRRQNLRLSDKRIEESHEELKLIDSAVRKLSSQYSEEEIHNAAKILASFTSNMVHETVDPKIKKH